MQSMSKALAVMAAAICAGTWLPATARADPGNDPCGMAVNLFCRFVPIAPDLEGDVDLTIEQPPTAAPAPPQSPLPTGICPQQPQCTTVERPPR